jgi:zeta-carotene desaturase
MAFKFLNAWDKIVLSRALASLIARQPQDDGTSFQDWLQLHHQTDNAIERFWKPILVSALSEDMDRIAVPYAAQVVRESMKSREARSMGIPSVPLTELYNAARDYVTSHGGAVRLRNSVQGFLPLEDGVRLELQDSEEEFDYAVAAVPFDSLGKILPDSAESRDLHEKLLHFETSPITGVHLWLDRHITDLPHAVLLDRTIQWMFHKSMLLAKSSDAALRASENGSGKVENLPSYVELVISSSKSLIEMSRQQIIDLALSELREFFPEACKAKLLKATVIKEVNATFSPKPGIDPYRPSSQTSWPNIVLAGDWTATGWPATMEGAVRSGYIAAQAILAHTERPRNLLSADLAATGFMRIFRKIAAGSPPLIV